MASKQDILRVTGIHFILILFLIFGNGCTQRGEEKEYLSPHISISPDDQYIAFAYSKHDVESIYIAKSDGTQVKQLTYPKYEYHGRPEFSPDGSKILFLSYSKKSEHPYSAIYLMDSDGNNPKQLTPEQEDITEAIFSPDGTTIYFLSSGYYGAYSQMYRPGSHDVDIYSIGIDGTNRRQLTDIKAYGISNLCISNDGKNLFFVKYGKENWLSSLSLDNPAKIVTILSGSFEKSIWGCQISPDNKTIAFIRPKQQFMGPYAYNLYLLNLQTRETKQITFLKSDIKSPRFFHDGTKILFMQDVMWPNVSSKYQLMQISSDGSNLKKIVLKP